ncbi:hypothetical protein TNCV_634221 [Trichonephila clavipes]|nr:hypothetical protein TNCV_634221 [Trichonephila clavipes]
MVGKERKKKLFVTQHLTRDIRSVCSHDNGLRGGREAQGGRKVASLDGRLPPPGGETDIEQTIDCSSPTPRGK